MMKCARILAIGAFVTVSSFPSQAGSTGLCVETVEASLEAGDPKVTLEKYFNCEKYEGSAYERYRVRVKKMGPTGRENAVSFRCLLHRRDSGLAREGNAALAKACAAVG